MEAWLESLTVLQRVMLFIAVPATLLLLIQTVMLFIGRGRRRRLGWRRFRRR